MIDYYKKYLKYKKKYLQYKLYNLKKKPNKILKKQFKGGLQKKIEDQDMINLKTGNLAYYQGHAFDCCLCVFEALEIFDFGFNQYLSYDKLPYGFTPELIVNALQIYYRKTYDYRVAHINDEYDLNDFYKYIRNGYMSIGGVNANAHMMGHCVSFGKDYNGNPFLYDVQGQQIYWGFIDIYKYVLQWHTMVGEGGLWYIVEGNHTVIRERTRLEQEREMEREFEREMERQKKEMERLEKIRQWQQEIETPDQKQMRLIDEQEAICHIVQQHTGQGRASLFNSIKLEQRWIEGYDEFYNLYKGWGNINDFKNFYGDEYYRDQWGRAVVRK